MFYQKAQAVGITAGLAIKAMAVILSSMGVLHVVQNNGGIQSFFDSFTLFNHEGLNALRDMAINNIVHNVKIKANNVVASIREFFNSWAKDELTDPFDILDGVIFTDTFTDTLNIPSTNSEKYYGNIGFVQYNDDYSSRFSLYYTPNARKVRVATVSSSFFNESVTFDNHFRGNTKITFQYQIGLDFVKVVINMLNYDRNTSETKTLYKHYPDGIYLITNPPGYVDPTYDIPQPQSIPRNGLDIAWDEASNKSISYIPEETKLEKLIEDIANASVETFVEKYMSWGKATTDSLTGPIISTETRVNQETGVEEQVVTNVTETVFDDIYEETHTQTGLLGSILGAITDIKDFIKSIFIPEEFKSLDFSPLQNIGCLRNFLFLCHGT
ncbi:MAG TPA: hypothetical protein GX708_22500 [Gallicola sp.]|nr:hypothetical protein [Gallicola sp.]